MISVVIISDIRLYSEGLTEIFNRMDAFRVVGTADNVELAVSVISSGSPDVVLVDMTMIASCTVINSIVSAYPGIRIVALAMSDDEDSILACAKAGIVGYVSREASLKQLVNAVSGVVDGELYCSKRIAAKLIHKVKSLSKSEFSFKSPKKIPRQPQPQFTLLTQREKQIAMLLSDGLSNKEIARHLMIEVSTVKNHVHHILGKMGVTSRVQVVSLLRQQVAPETSLVY